MAFVYPLVDAMSPVRIFASVPTLEYGLASRVRDLSAGKCWRFCQPRDWREEKCSQSVGTAIRGMLSIVLTLSSLPPVSLVVVGRQLSVM